MPAPHASAIQPEQFATFGQLLRFLRQRAGLTQRELSIAAGYSESQMSRLEQNQRAPDPAALAARFVPALQLDGEPAWTARLLELAAASRATGQPGEPATEGEAPLAPNNLPVQLTRFIGRDVELAEVRQLLSGDGARLLTLTGPGGTGKTRLSLEAAAGLLAAFPDGAWWVELAPLADPALIPQTVAAVLGIREEPDRPLTTTLTDHLRRKRALLILDNCEHLIQASARFAEAVLRACPPVCLLASSRELLGVAGERAFAVPSLRTPEPHETFSPESLRQYDAVRLFLDRAAATAPQFALTRENAAAVAQVCQRLDGIPLALELAAARLRMLPVEQLAARLDDAFRLLTGGSRTALPRHQTLQALIDWSYDLLPPAEQTLLRRLAVFAGGWTLEAAESICGASDDERRRTNDEGQTHTTDWGPATDDESRGSARIRLSSSVLRPDEILDTLARLVDKSLVQVADQGGAARYRLMETVRQYAQAKLAASGEAEAVRQRHAEYYVAWAEAGASPAGSPAPVWLDQVELEHDNLRAALTWSRLALSRIELTMRLGFVLVDLWYQRGYVGYWNEMRAWGEGILAMPETAEYPKQRAIAAFTLGHFLAMHGDIRAGEAYMAQCLLFFQELNDRLWTYAALNWLGWAARERGDALTACARLEESLAIVRELGDPALCGGTATLAEAMILGGDLAGAKALLDENIDRARRLSDVQAMGWTLNHLGHIAQLQGDFHHATKLHEASLPEFSQLGPRNLGHVWAYHDLGQIALAQGDARQAAAYFEMALAIARDIGDREAQAWCLAGLAGAAAMDEEPERAAWLWGAAEKLRLSLGVREAPCSHATTEHLQRRAAEQIGQAAFAAEWAAGQAVPLSEAIERALH